MAGECVRDFNIQRVEEAPGMESYHNSPDRDAFENQQFTNEELNWSATQHHQKAAEMLNNYTDEASFSNEAPTKGDTSLLGKTADEFMRLVATSEAETAEHLADSLSRAGATSMGQMRWFAGKLADLSTKALHGLGDIYKYESSFFGQDGQTSYDMLLMGELQMLNPKLQSARARLAEPLEVWRKNLTETANRCGRTLDEMCMEVGNLAIFEHMGERNEHLQQQWRNEHARLAAKRAAGIKLNKEELDHYNNYPEYIRALEANIDNEAIQLDEHGKRTVRSGGYTNGEATRLWNESLRRLGITNEEAMQLTADFRDACIQTRNMAAEGGAFSTAAVEKFPGQWTKYVPVKTKHDMTGIPTGDAMLYNQGRFHATGGMNDTPVDAYTSQVKYIEFLAHRIAEKDLGNVMKALLVRQHETGIDAGLRSYRKAQMEVDLKSSDPAIRAAAARRYQSADGGGVVVDMPVRNKDGSMGTEQRVIMFDPDWVDEVNNTGLTGAMLNQAITRASKFGKRPENSVANAMVTATSYMGQMVTRFTPLFSPANMNRDGFERMSHLAGRTIKRDDGSVVSSTELVSRFAFNMPVAMSYLLGALARKLPEGGKARAYIDEFMKNGLHYQPSAGMLQKKTDIGSPELKGFMQRLQESSIVGDNARVAVDGAQWVVKKLDGWNDYFNNVAPLAHYITLRDAGVSEAKAARSVMEVMNLYQTGTATQALSMFFPFVRPTMQAAGAMARTFGFAPNARGQFQMNKKGWVGFIGMTMGYAMLMPLFREMMGTDENGNYRFDLEPLENLMRATPLAIFGDAKQYIKIPNGFGPMQTAIATAIGFDRWQRGLMSTEDMAFNIIKSIARNVSPADWPNYSVSSDPVAWFAQSLSPMTIRPIVDVLANKNFAGRNITYGTNDPSVAKALQGRNSTADVWHDVAKTMLQYAKLDLAPEQWKTLFEGYSKGPLRIITEMMKEDNLRAAGLDKTAREELGPALTALGATMFYGKQVNSEAIAFYNTFDAMNEEVRFAGIKITSDVYGSDKEKRREYQTKVLKEARDVLGWSDAKIKAYLDMREANQALKKISQDFGKKHREDSAWLDDEAYIRSEYEAFNKAREEEMERAMERYYFNMLEDY